MATYQVCTCFGRTFLTPFPPSMHVKVNVNSHYFDQSSILLITVNPLNASVALI